MKNIVNNAEWKRAEMLLRAYCAKSTVTNFKLIKGSQTYGAACICYGKLVNSYNETAIRIVFPEDGTIIDFYTL